MNKKDHPDHESEEAPRAPEDDALLWRRKADELRQDAVLLEGYFQRLRDDVGYMENSWRWKLGNAIARIMERLRIIDRPPRLATDDAREILDTHDAWREGRRKRSNDHASATPTTIGPSTPCPPARPSN